VGASRAKTSHGTVRPCSAHMAVDPAVERFISNSLLFVPLADRKPFDEFRADLFRRQLLKIGLIVRDREMTVACSGEC
jgi:hypothetical protein